MLRAPAVRTAAEQLERATVAGSLTAAGPQLEAVEQSLVSLYAALDEFLRAAD